MLRLAHAGTSARGSLYYGTTHESSAHARVSTAQSTILFEDRASSTRIRNSAAVPGTQAASVVTQLQY